MRTAGWIVAFVVAAGSAGPTSAQEPEGTRVPVAGGPATTVLPPETPTTTTGTMAPTQPRTQPAPTKGDGSTSPITSVWAEGAALPANNMMVTWKVNRGCPTRDIRQMVESHFVAGDPGGDLTAHMKATRLNAGWRVDLTMEGPGGKLERVFVAGTCARALNETVAEIDLVVRTRELSAGSTRIETTTITAPPGKDVRNRWALLQVLAGPGLGLVKPVMGLLRLVIGFRATKWSVAATGTFLLPRTVLSGQEPPINVSIWLGSAGIRGCYVPKLGRVELGACATGEFGLMTATRTDADREKHRLPWIAVSLGPTMSIRIIKQFRLNFGLDVTLIAKRPVFTFNGKQDVCCDQRFGMSLVGGLEFLLP